MAVYLKEYLEKILNELEQNNQKTKEKVSQFILDNNWFSIKVDSSNWSIDEADAYKLGQEIKNYLLKDGGVEGIKSIFSSKFPETFNEFQKYIKSAKIDEESQFYIQDFFAYYLEKDLFLYSDYEIEELIECATNSLNKNYGMDLTRFINWLLEKSKTRYRRSYRMTQRYTFKDENGAYDLDDYLELMYRLFNDSYIEKNNMLYKAASSKNYADTWLFLSIHFICALRTTDLVRLGHPRLPDKPEKILESIKKGKWRSVDARKTLLSITTRLTYLNITPNKTRSAGNVSQIKFHVPESCQVLIGTLLAIAEAHYQLENNNQENPLIRKIYEYERITKYMGEEFGEFFLGRNFSSRSANKSYLQAIAMLADDVLEEKSKLNIKGYFLAALARSHKGSFDAFAQTTTLYLKDAQLGQLKPEMVAKELFERGVLSMVPSMLLTIVTRGKYKELSPSQQTQMIKEMNLTPSEIEKTLELSVRANTRATNALKMVVNQGLGTDQLLTICHRIGNGEAFSKQAESMCLLSALGQLCPFDDRHHCVGCQYELQTKSTLLLLIGEFNRLNRRYTEVTSDLEKGKIRSILEMQIKPCLEDMLQALSEQYGEDVLNDYEEIIKELVS